MLTEAEAKTKWCPFVRLEGAYAYGLPTHNRTTEPNKVGRDTGAPSFARAATCIGSQCMAWRAQETPEFKRKADAAYARGERGLLKSDTGYCGLAGKP